jgi:putative membrane protein
MVDLNPQDELARGRNHLAADRTLLSFLRSSLTLVSIGVGVDQVVRAIAPAGRPMDAWAHGLSLTLIALGVVNLGLATQDYRREMGRLRAPVYRYSPRWSLAASTSLVMLAIGVVTVVWLGVKLWW